MQVLSPKSHFGNFNGVLVPSHWGPPYGLSFWPESTKELDMRMQSRKNWWLGILLPEWRISAGILLLLVNCFAVFLTFFNIILFNIAILAVEREGKTAVVSQAHLPNTVLPWSPDTGWKVQPGILRWHHGLAVHCALLLCLFLETELGAEPT